MISFFAFFAQFRHQTTFNNKWKIFACTFLIALCTVRCQKCSLCITTHTETIQLFFFLFFFVKSMGGKVAKTRFSFSRDVLNKCFIMHRHHLRCCLLISTHAQRPIYVNVNRIKHIRKLAMMWYVWELRNSSFNNKICENDKKRDDDDERIWTVCELSVLWVTACKMDLNLVKMKRKKPERQLNIDGKCTYVYVWHLLYTTYATHTVRENCRAIFLHRTQSYNIEDNAPKIDMNGMKKKSEKHESNRN